MNQSEGLSKTPKSPQGFDHSARWSACLEAARPEPNEPPTWARSGHAQTLFGHFLPGPKLVVAPQRAEIPVSGEDRLVARYYEGSKSLALLLFHGLGGSADSDYMTRTARFGLDRGYHVFCVNHRGCGEGNGLALEPYHSGRGEDLGTAVAFVRQRLPGVHLVAVGFSLSGNALLTLLTGLRGDTLPDIGVAVNAPISLERAALAMKRGLNRLYDARFVMRLRREVRNRRRSGLLKREYRIPIWFTVPASADIYTAPEGGFRNREDYYHSCSTKDLLHRIETPTLLLTSRDDPMIRCDDYLEASLSPWTYLHLEQTGGHMGYLARRPTPLGSRFWLDYALDTYLRAIESYLRIT